LRRGLRECAGIKAIAAKMQLANKPLAMRRADALVIMFAP